jgi:hypothetical protein
VVDNKQFQQVQYATWDLVDSFRETSQAVADTLVTLQDRNLRFAQSLFLNWMEVLTQQTQSTQRLQQQWGQQTQKQQDAFQRLASASMQIYLDFLFAPFAFSRQPVDTTERLPFEKELLW